MQLLRSSATPTSATPSPSPTPTPKPKQVKASDTSTRSPHEALGRHRRSRSNRRGQSTRPGPGVRVQQGPAGFGEGQSVEVNYYGVNGRTGKKFDESFTNGQPVAFSLARSFLGSARTRGAAPGQPCADCHAGQGRLRPDGRQPASRNRGRRHFDLRRRPGRRAARRPRGHRTAQGGASDSDG